MPRGCRHLVLVLGDQLDEESSAFQGIDPQRDIVWMAENEEEATYVPSHKVRLVAFFASMRHFRELLRRKGLQVDYHELAADRKQGAETSFATLLAKAIKRHRPQRLIVVEPGDFRVAEQLRATAADAGKELEQRENHRFYCSRSQFLQWRSGRKTMVMEHFYRTIRQEHGILVEADGQPVGGAWNYDPENRQPFDRKHPEIDVPIRSFPPDPLTREVIEMVIARYPDHPGSLARFDLPVTRTAALEALDDFLQYRLAGFGPFQDAMWRDTDFLYHSRLSQAMNLGLLHPREAVDGALAAYQSGRVPLASCEGYIRQIIGWREYVRGIYWDQMPGYLEQNALQCDPHQDVPASYWDGQTEMVCIAQSMRLVLETAYAHHIQRLMVLGLFAQLYGVSPKLFHRWHMAMYADAVDWVSAPNTIGMSQYGDGGLMATKPYCASGAYIQRMSNYCEGCRYDPKQATGADACPVTTLYWDFLDRHRTRLKKNHRMSMQLKNLERKPAAQLDEIRRLAALIRSGARRS